MCSEKEQNACDELMAWTLSLREVGFIHQEVVDARAAQHETEVSTPISIVFALIGLYLHLEKGFSGQIRLGTLSKNANSHASATEIGIESSHPSHCASDIPRKIG